MVASGRDTALTCEEGEMGKWWFWNYGEEEQRQQRWDLDRLYARVEKLEKQVAEHQKWNSDMAIKHSAKLFDLEMDTHLRKSVVGDSGAWYAFTNEAVFALMRVCGIRLVPVNRPGQTRKYRVERAQKEEP